MAIETTGRNETLRRECEVGRLIQSFEDLGHLKDNGSKGEPRDLKDQLEEWKEKQESVVSGKPNTTSHVMKTEKRPWDVVTGRSSVISARVISVECCGQKSVSRSRSK